MREKADRLQLVELAPHGRGGHVEPARTLDEHLRADRLAGRNILLDDASQDLELAVAQLHALIVRPGPADGPDRRRGQRSSRPWSCARNVE